MYIRDATAADWPGIWSVVEPIIRAGETYTLDSDSSEESLRAKWLHLSGRGRTFVAIDDGGAVTGTAELHPNYGGAAAGVANAGFMVHPDHGGKGIARALADHVLEQARADGYRAMVFNAVVASNVRAVRLWESLGFEILATIPEAFDHPVEGLVGLHVMHRKLD